MSQNSTQTMDHSVRNYAMIDFTHAISNCDFDNLLMMKGLQNSDSWHAIKGLFSLPFLRFSRSGIQQYIIGFSFYWG